MRLATWNSQPGLKPNWDAIVDLDVDVLTVQECEPGTREWVERHHGWTCHEQQGRFKGVAVLARAPYKIETREPHDEPFFVSTVVAGPNGLQFRFVGFWAMTCEPTPECYAEQAAILIDKLPHDQLRNVVAGDFNRSRSADHMANVESLRRRGLVSAYHAHHLVEHTGLEKHPTSYHYFDTTRPYHMDFVFVPTDWRLRCVEVGAFEEYVEPRRSDHVPVVVSIDPEIVAPAR